MRLIKLFTLGIILFPVLNIYGVGIPGLSVGKFFLLIIIFCEMLLAPKMTGICIPKRLIPFVLWMLLSPLIYCFTDWLVVSSMVYKFIGVSGFWLTIAFAYRLIDWNLAVKYYEKCVVLFSIIFLVQLIFYFTVNLNLSLIIPSFPLADASSSDYYVNMQSSLQRQSSVFLEPAHFSVYISIFLILALRKSKGLAANLKSVLFITIVMLLTRSGNSYLSLIIIYTLYFIMNIKTVFVNKKGLIFILACLFFATPMYNRIRNVEEFNNLFSRVNELQSQGDRNTSGFERVYRGYYYYEDMDLFAKVVGVGQGNIEAYTNSHMLGQYGNLDTSNDSFYFNGIQQILIYGGIIGLLLFLWGIFPYIKHPESCITILLYLAICFISSTYNSSTMLMFLLFADAFKRNCIKITCA